MNIAIAAEKRALKDNALLLAADVGGTKTNMYLFRVVPAGLESIKEHVFHTAEYNSMEAMIDDFLAAGEKPDRICFGVAGPVIKGTVQLTNLGWPISAHSISQHYNNINVALLNDLEATAYSINALNGTDLYKLPSSGAAQPGNVAVIAPGTGLGEAGLYWDGTDYHPFATEGGHCDFAPRNAQDIEVYKFLANRFGHVSWERVLSGRGIENIFDYLCSVEGMQVCDSLDAEIAATSKAAAISAGADKYEEAAKTIALFFTYLAQESANLALKFMATGGLYIGGGIVPKNLQYLDEDIFRKAFAESGRLSTMLLEIPVTIILNDKAALIGAAYHGATKL